MNDHNGLPHGLVRKESACNAGDTFDPPGFDPWVEDTWRRTWQPSPVFLPENSQGERNLASRSSKGRKEWNTV